MKLGPCFGSDGKPLAGGRIEVVNKPPSPKWGCALDASGEADMPDEFGSESAKVCIWDKSGDVVAVLWGVDLTRTKSAPISRFQIVCR